MYYLFIDESGDHGLKTIDKDFPVFVLCGVLIHHEEYKIIEDRVNSLKRSIWGDKKVIFHSTDIRRKRKEFTNLIDPVTYESFMIGLNNIMSKSNYTVIASCVDKLEFVRIFGKIITNIYSVSLSFIMERMVFFLDDVDPKDKKVQICIEARGKKEDASLRSDFDIVISRGTNFVTSKRFQDLGANIHFRPKSNDVTGLQLSDLIAYPIARHILDKERANPAFDIIFPKIYSKNGKVYGIKKSP